MSGWNEWARELDSLGQRERIFDAPGQKYACGGNRPRRPYLGEGGLFFLFFNSGMSPMQALGEALVEQDGE
jgi:hypothetical protein